MAEYHTQEGTVRIEVLYESETFWLNQKKIAELVGGDLRTISYHLGEIYASGELSQAAILQRIRRVQKEGNREVSREIEFYNLDAIISVGYRVNSTQATQFRIWATQTLREFVIKGFVLDDERLAVWPVAVRPIAVIEAAAALCAWSSLAAFLAMLFTGASTFTSLSVVRRERAVPGEVEKDRGDHGHAEGQGGFLVPVADEVHWGQVGSQNRRRAERGIDDG